MVDSFVDEIDDLFRRKLERLSDTERAKRESIPVDVTSLGQLKSQMVKRVWSSNLTDEQKRHTVNNIEEYELPQALWETSSFFQPVRIEKLTLEFMPEEYERREIEARRVRTSVKKGRFASTLSGFKTPTSRRQLSEQVADTYELSPNTISRDISPLYKAGYLEKVSWGIYRLTPFGKETLESL